MFVCLFRSMILYLLLIAAIRLMGKRQIGEMGPSEFVVTMLIADLASVPMQDLGIPLLSGVVPILTVLAMELLLSCVSFFCVPLRRLLNGKPVILMEKGKLVPENLKKTRLTPDELSERLRDKGVTDLSTVAYAILETDGQVSVLVASQEQPPTARELGCETDPIELPWTIISCGALLRENLRLSGHTERWLEKLLKKHQCQPRDILLLTVTQSGKLYLSLREESS